MRLPDGFAIEKAAQFFNLITAWDLVNSSGVQAGQWLAVTAGNATVSTMALQFARARGIKVISIVRREHSDLRAMGAAHVISLSNTSRSLGESVRQITSDDGIQGIIDNVGGSVTGELIRALSFGGRLIVNGGMSPDRFDIHNFDILLKGVEIKPYVYRYFFAPPPSSDFEELLHIATLSAATDFKVPVAGMNHLAAFKYAIDEAMSHPDRGKLFFRMTD
jgi:NADPH:quinone reductase-like Zn-dependent oxidoreductase